MTPLDKLASIPQAHQYLREGQKCTAIRRAFVPTALYAAVAEAAQAQLARTVVGNPRNEQVAMGALVSRAQWQTAQDGIALLAREADLLLDGRRTPLVDADPAVAACMGPTLLGVDRPERSVAARALHEIEVFGPVATLMAFEDTPQLEALVARGEGSLVASIVGDDDARLAQTALALALALAPWHGRVHVISPAVAATHTGHGNVMPQSLHGGPGRAGGSEELGGLRALNFYQRRTALQAATGVLAQL